MTKYEKEAKEWIQQFKKYVESDPLYSNKGGTIQQTIVYNAKECALILCDSHIYSENNSPFNTLYEWQQNDNRWQHVKEAIKAIEA